MNKNTKTKEQMTMFGTYETLSYEEEMEVYVKRFGRNIINLREELKSEVPNTTYLTHAIHNFYPAKFIPQVPRFVIRAFDLKGKVILDPFAGSGTTAVESLVTLNSNISNDINPITKFLIDVKTLRVIPKNYASYMERLSYHTGSALKGNLRFVPKWGNVGYWYPPEIFSTLIKIWGYIHNIDDLESDMKHILKASALYLSRKYSYGEDDSPKLFKSKQKAIKIKELVNKFHQDGEGLLQAELQKKAKEYLGHIIQFNLRLKNEYKKIDSLKHTHRLFLMVLNKSIEELGKTLGEESVDCIITSPPYIYAQEYFRSTKIDMYWLDMINDETIRKLTKREIGQKLKSFYNLDSELTSIESFDKAHASIKELSKSFKTEENIARCKAYFGDMLYFVQLSSRLLRPHGIFALFIGEPKVFGHTVNVKDILSEMMDRNGFRIKYTFFDIIKSRHLSKNRLNENPDGIPGEWIIIGEKL